MSKEEAIQAMREGKKVTHPFFASDEWITMDNGKVLCEDGCRHNAYEFWLIRTHAGFLAGWEIYDGNNFHLTPPSR